MITIIRKSAVGVAAVAALGLGGSALAGAADDTSSTTGTANAAKQSRPARAALSSTVAANVRAAAQEEVPGATVLRVEGGGLYATPYHAHIQTSSSAQQVVLVDDSFTATAVQTDRGRGGPGGRGPGGPGGHRGETALTGAKKAKVEAAVLARYKGATIDRTETNSDGSAPYESHITTKAGRELEVLVGKNFEVVGAEQHPARP